MGIREVVIGSLGPVMAAGRSEVIRLSWWFWVVGAWVGLPELVSADCEGFRVHCVQLSFFPSPAGQKQT